MLGLFSNRLFLSALLCDYVVLDHVTRDLVVAIVYPARQLLSNLILILIVVNIFMAAVFFFYRHEVVGFDVNNLWASYKLGFSYGIRGEYGIGHEMTNTLGMRTFLDLAFYFIVSILLCCQCCFTGCSKTSICIVNYDALVILSHNVTCLVYDTNRKYIASGYAVVVCRRWSEPVHLLSVKLSNYPRSSKCCDTRSSQSSSTLSGNCESSNSKGKNDSVRATF
jgi:hypothetical protein